MTQIEIQNLEERLGINRVIERYIPLVYKGTKAIGLCPFHDDQYPSLQVDLRLQRFTCFCCGEHGDAIHFIQKMEECSFNDATRMWMEDSETHPAVTKKNIENNKRGASKKSDLNEEGLEELFYFRYADQPDNEMAFESTHYEPRKPEKDPNNLNERLFHYLKEYDPEDERLFVTYNDFEVKEAPELLPDKWMTLSGKVIFPLRDILGDLVGFAGGHKGKRRSRYIYSSVRGEILKENILYGYFQGQEKVQYEAAAYLVESFEDVLAMHAAGFINTITTCGTSLSREQCRLMQQEGIQEIYLLFENDEQGQKATKKIARALRKEGIKVRVLTLPVGENVDSLFRKLGKEEFIQWVDETTFSPHLTEEQLVVACLCFPTAKVFTKREEYNCDFASFLLKLLPADHVPFVRKRHTSLLESFISQDQEIRSKGIISDSIPVELRKLAHDLLTRHAVILKQTFKRYALQRRITEEKSLSHFFLTLVYAYYDARLYGQINDILLRFRDDPEWADKDTLLASLDNEYEISGFISDLIHTLGVN